MGSLRQGLFIVLDVVFTGMRQNYGWPLQGLDFFMVRFRGLKPTAIRRDPLRGSVDGPRNEDAGNIGMGGGILEMPALRLGQRHGQMTSRADARVILQGRGVSLAHALSFLKSPQGYGVP
jgi:hypothetical protein